MALLLSLTVLLILTISTRSKINIALHAQVSPANGKIVGSVITTDGLQKGLIKRHEVNRVDVFYPGEYDTFFLIDWDVIIIEGWFLSIDQFIRIARNHDSSSYSDSDSEGEGGISNHINQFNDDRSNSYSARHRHRHSSRNGVLILFFCLDPMYPGLEHIFKLDIDGILTNSDVVMSMIPDRILKRYLMLAADPSIMKPADNSTISTIHSTANIMEYGDRRGNRKSNSDSDTDRDTVLDNKYNKRKQYGAVYIGAGGNMLAHKPSLYQMLLDAIPFRLRLHGSSWENVPVLNELSMGVLPRFEIAAAYSSAEVVIASTMKSQEDYGMINNRIFEALSCGAIIVTEYSETLDKLRHDIRTVSSTSAKLNILFVNDTHNVQDYINYVQTNSELASKARKDNRDFILQRHSWDHRVVEILDFINQIKESYSVTINIDPVKKVEISTDNLQDLAIEKYSCVRYSCPKILIIVSRRLLNNADYLSVFDRNFKFLLLKQYHLSIMNEDTYHTLLLQSKCLIKNSVSYDDCKKLLEDYHVIMTVITPFDQLDCLMSMIPRIVLGKDAINEPIYQKRASYYLGHSSHLINGKNRQELQSILDQYDMIWYRDYYELQLLQKIPGVLLNPLRIEHGYGIGYNTKDRSDQKLILFVCFYGHRELCTESNRHSIAESYFGETASIQYRLLLVGGAFSDWLDLDDTASYECLRRTTHLSKGPTTETFMLFAAAMDIILLHGDVTKDDCNSNTSSVVSPDGKHIEDIESSNCLDTVPQNIWPIVLATLVNARVVLSHPNSQFIADVDHDCTQWNSESYLPTKVTSGLDRLHHFGVRESSCSIKQLPLKFYDHYPTHTAEEKESAAFRTDLINQVKYLLSKMDMSSIEQIAVLEVYVNRFTVGRDGTLCIVYKSKVMNCLLRSFRYVLVTTGGNIKESGESNNQILNMLEFSIRGNYFIDEIFSEAVNVSLSDVNDFLDGETINYRSDVNYILDNIFHIHLS